MGRGYTLEARLKVISSGGTSSAGDLKVSDGTKSFALKFKNDQVFVPSGYLVEGVKSYAMDTTGSYHVYRVVVKGTSLKVFVDETQRLSGTLNSSTTSKSLQWGDTSITAGEGGVVFWDSLKYTTQGAFEVISTAGLTQFVKNVDYNAAGQMTRIEYGNGAITVNTYDPKTFRLKKVKTTDPLGAAIQDLSYTYDSAGNILSITDAVNTASQTFQYDALNRLTQAVGNYGTKTFSYDQLGNLLLVFSEIIEQWKPNISTFVSHKFVRLAVQTSIG